MWKEISTLLLFSWSMRLSSQNLLSYEVLSQKLVFFTLVLIFFFFIYNTTLKLRHHASNMHSNGCVMNNQRLTNKIIVIKVYSKYHIMNNQYWNFSRWILFFFQSLRIIFFFPILNVVFTICSAQAIKCYEVFMY